MAFGIGGRIKKELGRAEERVKDPRTIGAALLGPIGYFIGDEVGKVRDQFRAARRARKQAAAAEAEMRALQRRRFEEQRVRQAKEERLLQAEQAKQRRISIAESLVGAAFGMVDSAPVDGPNMDVNLIPVLDDVDSMGNSIPEV